MIFSHQHQQKKIPITVIEFSDVDEADFHLKKPHYSNKKYSTVHTQSRFFLVQPDPVALQSQSPLWCVCTYTPPCPRRWLRCVGRSGFIRCFWGWAERWVTAWKFFVLSFSSKWQEEGHKIWNIFLLFSLRVLLELVGPVISNYLRQRHSKSLGNKFCNNNKPLIVTKHLLFI